MHWTSAAVVCGILLSATLSGRQPEAATSTPTAATPLPTAGPLCGNGIIEADEECDDGGTCVGGGNAGMHCSAETQCSGNGVCVGGPKAETACTGDSACPGGRCLHCVPFGGDGCAANCTTETAVPFNLVAGQLRAGQLLPGTSGATLWNEFLGPVAVALDGNEALVVGKQRNGQISVVVPVNSVQFAKLEIQTFMCGCLRAVAAKTCGGTIFQTDGTLAIDCTAGYTSGDAVCPVDQRCAFVHGEGVPGSGGNSASGVIGCAAAVDGVDALVTQDSNGSADPPQCNVNDPSYQVGLSYPTCGAAPVMVVSGIKDAGAAIIWSSTAMEQSFGDGCSSSSSTFCTDAESFSTRGRVTTLPTVTGTAAAEMFNVNQYNQDTQCTCSAGQISCYQSECSGPITINGMRASCDVLQNGSLVGLGLASAFTALSEPTIGDTVITMLLQTLIVGTATPTMMPTATPTSTLIAATATASRTPTRPTPTATRTRPTFTPTRTPRPTGTFTVTPTPVPNIRQLASSGGSLFDWVGDPQISDDGAVVVYENGRGIERATTDGQSHTSIPGASSECFAFAPRPSASGGQIVMTCKTGPLYPFGDEDIAFYDGSAVSVITQSGSHVVNLHADISGDGQTIVFASNADYTGGNADGRFEIYRWRGGPFDLITHSALDSYSPQISADGQRLLFWRGHTVYVYDDQGGERPIASPKGTAQLARDGRSVVFSTPAWVLGPRVRARMQVFRAEVDGSMERLSNFVGDVHLAEFAANGDASRVAVVFPDRGVGEGALLTSVGALALPGVPPDARSLSFDAAGRKLAFSSNTNLARQNAWSGPAVFVADIPPEPGPPVISPPVVPPVPSACAGDCDLSGTVTVDELVGMVNAALGDRAVTLCLAGDLNLDGQITVDEILIAVRNALDGCAPTNPPVERGLQALGAGALAAAKDQFCLAAASAAPDDASHLYCALTRVVAALDDPRLRTIAEQNGVTVVGGSRDLCGWYAVLPNTLQAGMPTGTQSLGVLRNVLAPEIDAAVADLKRLSGSGRILFLPNQMPYCVDRSALASTVVIDRGDALVLAAVLEALRATLELATAYNFDLSPSELLYASPEDLLAQNPALLSLTSSIALQAAQQQFAAALTDLSAAIRTILDETRDQSRDLFVIAAADHDSATRTAHILDLLHDALFGQVVFGADVGLQQPAHLDLSPFFAGQFASLRPLLPAFDNNGGFSSQVPNPTFSGMAPELTQQAIAAAFPQLTRFLKHLGRNDCWHTLAAADQTECTAQQTQYGCGIGYFYVPSCHLYSCPCTF